MSTRLPLAHVLAEVTKAFVTAKAWTDPRIKVKQTYRQVNFAPVAQGPRTELPPDPFSAHAAVRADPLSEDAKLRYYLPLGEALALHGRTHGAAGPEGLELTVEQGEDFEGDPTVKVTATERR